MTPHDRIQVASTHLVRWQEREAECVAEFDAANASAMAQPEWLELLNLGRCAIAWADAQRMVIEYQARLDGMVFAAAAPHAGGSL